MDEDALRYRQHADNIRRLVASIKGHAATAALLLAEEYERRANHLEGRPTAAAYVQNAESVGAMVAAEREIIATLVNREDGLVAELAAIRQQRLMAETRVEAILITAKLFDIPNAPRSSTPPPSYQAAADAAGVAAA